MGRLIDPAAQLNQWARASDDDAGTLEPQRSDLFYADFSNVVAGVNSAIEENYGKPNLSGLTLPQHLQSITFPEQRMRAEPFRRESVPFNMPSWDDPLDAMKMTFLVPADDRDVTTGNVILCLLERWMLLSRMGRPSRAVIYGQGTGDVNSANAGWIPLPESGQYAYRAQCAFDFEIMLLRGGDPETMLQSMLAMRANYIGQQSSPVVAGSSSAVTNGQNLDAKMMAAKTGASGMSQLNVASTFYVKQAWLGGYKLNDLSYTRSELLLCEATVYPEAIYRL